MGFSVSKLASLEVPLGKGVLAWLSLQPVCVCNTVLVWEVPMSRWTGPQSHLHSHIVLTLQYFGIDVSLLVNGLTPLQSRHYFFQVLNWQSWSSPVYNDTLCWKVGMMQASILVLICYGRSFACCTLGNERAFISLFKWVFGWVRFINVVVSHTLLAFRGNLPKES